MSNDLNGVYIIEIWNVNQERKRPLSIEMIVNWSHALIQCINKSSIFFNFEMEAAFFTITLPVYLFNSYTFAYI